MSAKAQLRRRFAALRDAIGPEQRATLSRQIHTRLLDLPELAGARSVFTYVSYHSEVETHTLIEQLLQLGKTLAVPLVTGPGVMQAHVIHSTADLRAGAFGILEARTANLLAASPNVALVPGLAFDQFGHRLGKGTAYYDRYLAAHPATTAIGLCFDRQIVQQIPADPHDVPMSLIVTDQRVIPSAGRKPP